MLYETLKNKIETLEIQKKSIEAEKAQINAQITELEKQEAVLDVALLPVDAKLEAYYECADILAVDVVEKESANGEGDTPEKYTFETGV